MSGIKAHNLRGNSQAEQELTQLEKLGAWLGQTILLGKDEVPKPFVECMKVQ